jgi:hypothetical protein
VARVKDTQPQPLELDRPRGIGELLALAISLFLRHSGLFLSVTLLVVAPVVVLVDGAWGGALRDGSDAHAGTGAAVVSGLLTSFAIPAFVTGLHAVIVRELGAGRVLGVAAALRAVAPRLPAALGAVALYTAGVAIGGVLLLLPGVWLSVRWYFGAQAAVLDGRSPAEALDASAQLTKDRWWRTAWALVAAGFLFGGIGALAREAAGAVHDGVAYVTLVTVIQAIALSLSALFGTLLFFALRAERVAEDPLVPAV